jgi:hypothetical protein
MLASFRWPPVEFVIAGTVPDSVYPTVLLEPAGKRACENVAGVQRKSQPLAATKGEQRGHRTRRAAWKGSWADIGATV